MLDVVAACTAKLHVYVLEGAKVFKGSHAAVDHTSVGRPQWMR